MDERGRAVAAYYDRLAPVYGAGAYFQARRHAVLAAIRSDIAAARRLLDLGCGNGSFAAAFVARHRSRRVVGADLSPDMLQAARRRLGERVALLRTDATALPFRAGSFDAVFMSHVLQLVPDIEGCIAEVAHSLAPGGLLVATVGAGQWSAALRALVGREGFEQLTALLGEMRAGRAADEQTRIAAACTRAGLRPQWRTAPFSVPWPAVEEWVRIRWLTIADAERRAVADAWLAQLRARTAGVTVAFAETLLLAHKPPAAMPGRRARTRAPRMRRGVVDGLSARLTRRVPPTR